METHDEEADRNYIVVINHEEQYSIWPAEQALPNGWREAGRRGIKSECLTYIQEVWKDMRPLSVRRAVEEHTNRSAES